MCCSASQIFRVCSCCYLLFWLVRVQLLLCFFNIYSSASSVLPRDTWKQVFHESQYAAMLLPHNGVSQNGNPSLVFVGSEHCGLSNNLLSLASTIILSLLTNRTLYCDWNNGGHVSELTELISLPHGFLSSPQYVPWPFAVNLNTHISGLTRLNIFRDFLPSTDMCSDDIIEFNQIPASSVCRIDLGFDSRRDKTQRRAGCWQALQCSHDFNYLSADTHNDDSEYTHVHSSDCVWMIVNSNIDFYYSIHSNVHYAQRLAKLFDLRLELQIDSRKFIEPMAPRHSPRLSGAMPLSDYPVFRVLQYFSQNVAPTVQLAADDFLRHHNLGNIMGVHLRRSFMTSDEMVFALDCILRQFFMPGSSFTHIFLAADHTDTRNWLRAVLGERLLSLDYELYDAEDTKTRSYMSRWSWLETTIMSRLPNRALTLPMSTLSQVMASLNPTGLPEIRILNLARCSLFTHAEPFVPEENLNWRDIDFLHWQPRFECSNESTGLSLVDHCKQDSF